MSFCWIRKCCWIVKEITPSTRRLRKILSIADPNWVLHRGSRRSSLWLTQFGRARGVGALQKSRVIFGTTEFGNFRVSNFHFEILFWPIPIAPIRCVNWVMLRMTWWMTSEMRWPIEKVYFNCLMLDSVFQVWVWDEIHSYTHSHYFWPSSITFPKYVKNPWCIHYI